MSSFDLDTHLQFEHGVYRGHPTSSEIDPSVPAHGTESQRTFSVPGPTDSRGIHSSVRGRGRGFYNQTRGRGRYRFSRGQTPGISMSANDFTSIIRNVTDSISYGVERQTHQALNAAVVLATSFGGNVSSTIPRRSFPASTSNSVMVNIHNPAISPLPQPLEDNSRGNEYVTSPLSASITPCKYYVI